MRLEVVADGAVHLLVAEGLAGDVGRAVRLAAAALGAAVDVPALLPGEVLHRRRSEGGVLRLEVELAQGAGRRQPGEQDVRERRDDVEVLPEGEDVQEDEDEGEVDEERGERDRLELRRADQAEVPPVLRSEADEEARSERPGRREERACLVPHGPERSIEGDLRDHQAGDEEEDHDALGGERDPVRLRHEPPPQEPGDADERAEDDEVLHEQVGPAERRVLARGAGGGSARRTRRRRA